jgi:hypothetical protein
MAGRLVTIRTLDVGAESELTAAFLIYRLL